MINEGNMSPDRNAMTQTTNVLAPPKRLPPEEEETIDSDSDKDSEVVSLTLRRTRPNNLKVTRRQPIREIKQPINYKVILA